jgi:hypothetical protein
MKMDGGSSTPTWGIGQSAPAKVREAEVKLECRVSETIGDMRLLWIDVPDAAGPVSDRAYLERNIIGLLSRANLLRSRKAPAPGWLGYNSADWRIAASGLWNLDHLFYRPDPQFLEVLEAYVTASVGHEPSAPVSLAPAGWHSRHAELVPNAQFELFQKVTLPDGT